MATTINGTTGVTFPAGGVGNPAGAVVGTTDTQTLTNKTITGAVITAMASSVITSGTAVASTSGTGFDFTGIPSWVKRITVMLYDVSLSGTSNLVFRLGDSGGIEITGYSSGSTSVSNSTPNTTNGNGATENTSITTAGAVSTAAAVYQGHCFMTQLDDTRWVISGILYATSINRVIQFAGRSSLTTTLTQVRITTVNGTDTFDAGSINILYE